ncbi:HEAT repeat domain-containing protein [Armatimonas sp.]|uniref:HEAT repeat domain-containing protein n=1 Tax=Armatimonas sp. TaxID=1872638 RepID=UPI00286CC348|nr:HEAT repeat domain-containing protein [Armatimonas sp.]
MQERENLARLSPVEARFATMSRLVSPAERKILTTVWTATLDTLLQYVTGPDPRLATAAIGEIKNRSKSATTDFDNTRVNATLAECLAPKTNVQVRNGAALTLGERNDRRSIPVLRSLLTPTEKNKLSEGAVPLRAAFFLARFQDTVSYPEIRKLDSQIDDATKRHFADLLGMMGDSKSVSILRELLENPYHGTRSHAALSLGRVKDRSSVPALIRALTDGYATVRRDAAWALAAIGGTKALPALRKAITAENSKTVPAHGFRGAQEMAREAVAALEHGKSLEIARDWRGDPLGTRRF